MLGRVVPNGGESFLDVPQERAGSNGPLLCGKQTTFEGGMRTPTVAWWSSGRARGVSQVVGTHMDLLPTLAELAGAELPKSLVLDGRSLAGLLVGGREADTARPVYFYRGNILYAVRWEQYKVRHGSLSLGSQALTFQGSLLDLDHSPRGTAERLCDRFRVERLNNICTSPYGAFKTQLQ